MTNNVNVSTLNVNFNALAFKGKNKIVTDAVKTSLETITSKIPAETYAALAGVSIAGVAGLSITKKEPCSEAEIQNNDYKENSQNSSIVDAKKTKRPGRMKTFARSIMKKGNGEQRIIVSGFTDANLDATHFKKIATENFWGIRPVVKGFCTDKKMFCAKNHKGKIKYFPNFSTPQIKRHVVFDVNPPRTVVQGFNQTFSNTVSTNATNQTTPQPVKMKDLYAEKRIVVQGFGDSSKEPTKKLDLTNSTERVNIKGFSI